MTTAIPTTAWQRLKHFPDGHTYFRIKDHPSVVYLADQSGPTPDKTSDGVMYVDVQRGMLATWDRVSLAVIDRRGLPGKCTPIGFDKAPWLAHFMKLPIKALNGEFSVALTSED